MQLPRTELLALLGESCCNLNEVDEEIREGDVGL